MTHKAIFQALLLHSQLDQSSVKSMNSWLQSSSKGHNTYFEASRGSVVFTSGTSAKISPLLIVCPTSLGSASTGNAQQQSASEPTQRIRRVYMAEGLPAEGQESARQESARREHGAAGVGGVGCGRAGVSSRFRERKGRCAEFLKVFIVAEP